MLFRTMHEDFDRFHGIFAPLITPFDLRGEVDENVLRQIVDFTIERGVHGVFICGSAGQGPVMTTQQRKSVALAVINQTRRRVPVVAMVGAADVETSIELALHAEQNAADAIAVVPPYYYTDHSDYEVIAHIRRVAESTDLPCFLYNNPPYTGVDLTPKLVKQILEVTNSVIAIKLAWGTADMISRYREALPETFRIFSGEIRSLFPGFYLGAAGTINPPMVFLPELCVEFWNALQSKDNDKTMSCYAKINAICSAVENTRGKMRTKVGELGRLRGFNIKKYPRWDSQPLTGEEISELQKVIRAAHIEPVELTVK